MVGAPSERELLSQWPELFLSLCLEQWSNDIDYTQSDSTQLDPYQQGPLEQEHEIQFQSNSDEESDNGPRTTRSGTQYTLLGIELAALNVEEKYTKETYKLGSAEAWVAELQFRDQSMEQEEFILFSLTKAEKLYTTVEWVSRYENQKKE